MKLMNRINTTDKQFTKKLKRKNQSIKYENTNDKKMIINQSKTD